MIVELKGGLDATASQNLVNLLPTVNANGSLSLSRAQLERMAGGVLADGSHTLHLTAKDLYGNKSQFDFSFTLDTKAPVAPANLRLTPDSDTGISHSDGITQDTTPTVTGQAEAGARVNLWLNGALVGQTTASSVGAWEITLRELNPGSYKFNATATDIAGNTSRFSSPLSVQIEATNAFNQAPTDITLSASRLAENVPSNTVVGNFTTVDPNSNDVHSYQLVAGIGDIDNSAFEIVSDRLQLKFAPDFETKENYSIRVRTTDKGGLSLEKSLAIQITNVNEAPIGVTLTDNAIAENSAVGTVIGQLSAIDPDRQDTHTYTLVDDALGRFQLNGDRLVVANSSLLDFEQATSHRVKIQTADAGGLALIQEIAINLVNVNEMPVMSARLLTDSGYSATDGLTKDPTITGKLLDPDLDDITAFKASFDGQNFTSILPQRQADGSFTLTQTQLSSIYGKSLTDGSYTLHLTASDEAGNTVATNLAFTLDTTNPILRLTAPDGNALYSPTVRLLGSASDSVQLDGGSYTIDSQSPTALNIAANGQINQLISANGLSAGSHHIEVSLRDLAGNLVTQGIDLTVSPDFTISAIANPGWGQKTATSITLAEGNSFLTQTFMSVGLGNVTGQRLIEFDLDAKFDFSDVGRVSEDLFSIYLRDPANPQKTLLDGGELGSSLFSLSGREYNAAAGIVRFDGKRVQIDTSRLTNAANGQLVFQLLNQDTDSGTTVNLTNLTTTVKNNGTPGRLIEFPIDRANPAPTVDLSGYTANSSAKLLVSNVRFDTATNKYIADLQVQNTGNSNLSRRLAVLLTDLPDGVTLANPTGVNEAGIPYLNLENAIIPGGLSPQEISKSVQIIIDNPNLANFSLKPVFLAGAADVAPQLANIGTINLKPGQKWEIPLIESDANGYPITVSIKSDGELPAGEIASNNHLAFSPTPDQIGTYKFTLVAKQGKLVTTQEVTVNVVPDPVTTTRISGVLQDTNQAAIAGAIIDVGGVQTTTQNDGSFILELPNQNVSNVLKINGQNLGGKAYGTLNESLSLLLGHDLYAGFNNQIEKTIYVPLIDPANATTIDPTQTQSIGSINLQGAKLTIAANSALDANNNPYTGNLSLTEVPITRLPAALPDTLRPDVVVAVQAEGLKFNSPASLSLPNRAGYTAGTKLDLYSLNPLTGSFEKTGVGEVSADGQAVNTISGGITFGSWHFFAPMPVAPIAQEDNPYNELPGNRDAKSAGPINSEAEFQSGAVKEAYNLVGYQSAGLQRSFQLRYDSLRADPRQIVHLGYQNFNKDGNSDQLIAQLSVRLGLFKTQIQSSWNLPENMGENDLLNAGLLIDMSQQKSGIYDYELRAGLEKNVTTDLFGASTVTEGRIVHVNSVDSVFGSGWGLAGLQELVLSPYKDKSILLIDGDGNQRIFAAGQVNEGITSYATGPGDFSKLEKLADGSFRRTMTDQTVYLFDANGKLTAVRDRNNNQTTYTYNQYGIAEIQDPAGLITKFNYTGAKITSIVDPTGRVTNLNYDAKGNLIEVVNPDGSSVKWGYDDLHHMTEAVDAQGNVGKDFYDEFGRVIKAVRKDGTTVRIKAAETQGLVLSTNSNTTLTGTTSQPTGYYIDGSNNATTIELNQFGQPVKTTDALGLVSTNVYNNFGQLVKAIDGNNNVTSYTYDERGNVTGIIYGEANSQPANTSPFSDQIDLYPIEASVQNPPKRIATGDINNDGIDDVVATTANGKITTFLGNASGQLTQLQSTNFVQLDLAFTDFQQLAINRLSLLDINKDGIKDLVVDYERTSHITGIVTTLVGIVKGRSDGIFTSSNLLDTYPLSSSTTFDPYSFPIADVAYGDFNGDGFFDIVGVSADDTPKVVSYQSNNSYANLSKVILPVVTNMTLNDFSKLGVGDFNKDGKQDLVTVGTNSEGNSILNILQSNGNGTFTALPNSISLPDTYTTIKVSDLNSDGLLDIIVGGDNLYGFINQGNGQFQTQLYSNADSDYINIADINKNGTLDLVTANIEGQMLVYQSKGDGTFINPSNFYQSSPNLKDFATGDFNSDGKIDTVAVNSSGLGIKLNQLSTATGNSNPNKVFTYNSKYNLITSITDEIGRRTLYNIDENTGNLLSLVRVVGNTANDADDVVTSYTYTNVGNIKGLLDTITDALGNITKYQYDQLGNIVKIFKQGQLLTTFEYDSAGNQSAVIDGNNHRTEYQYDARNRLIKTTRINPTNAGNSITTSEYYSDGLIKNITDANGNITAFEYDQLGRLIKTKLPENINQTNTGGQIINQYDKAGNLISVTDANDNTTKYQYDGRNRLIEISQIVGGQVQQQQYQYDNANNLIRITDDNGKETKRKYDTRNRVIEQIDPLNQSISYTYDNASQLIETKNQKGDITKYTYDDLGRQTSITTPLNFVTKTEYDKESNITAVVDALNHRTEYGYNYLNQRTSIKDANGSITKYQYDTVGNLLETTDALNRITQYQYDALNRQIKVIDALNGTTTIDYDKVGNITSTTDKLGHQTQYKYDVLNRHIQTINAKGDATNTTYDKVGNVIAWQDELGRVTTYGYDSRNRRTSVTDALGSTTTTQYDGVGNIRSVTDAKYHTTEYKYDGNNRLIETKDALGYITQIAYDAIGNVIRTVDANNRTTEYKYDKDNRRTEIIDALGNSSTTSYDAVGNVIASTDELGRITNYNYDNLNRQISVTDALNNSTNYSYDAVGNVIASTDELGRTTSYNYDQLNRQTSVTDPLSHSTNYSYDAVGNLIEITDALGRTTNYGYDKLNRQTSTKNALGNSSTTSYDAVGNVIESTDELGQITTFGYDFLNRRITVTNPLGYTTTTNYDAVGNVVSLINPLGHTTKYTYDALDRQTGVIDASNRTTTTTYDAVGNVTQIADPSGNKTSYTYDALDRVLTDTNQLGFVRSYQYDAVGNRTAATDRNGRKRTFSYDALDRQTAETWKDGNNNSIRTINYTYDATSQLISVNDVDSTYSYTYDNAGRLTSVDNIGTNGAPNVKLNYSYDAVNNLISTIDTINGQVKGTTAYTYDALNRTTRIVQGGNGVADKRIDMTYDAASQMKSLTRYSDLAASQLVAQSNYTYDANGRLVYLTHSKGANTLADYSWSYDAANRLTQSVSNDGTSNYNYDSTDQLIGTDHSYQNDESYTYDANGNRTNSGYSTGTDNRLLTDGKYNYEYDSEGNRTKRIEIATGEVTQYSWDYRNRLTQVTVKDVNGNVIKQAEYTYDVYDRRISKSVDPDGDGALNAQIERFVHDGDNIALVFDGNGNQTHRYLYGTEIDSILADENASGDVIWSLADNQGSIRDLVDNSGNAVNHIVYDSFGNITSQTNRAIDTKFTYTGRELDAETGLSYYRARYYDAAVGSFISIDPIGFEAGDANLYRYVLNSPINYTDPSGNNPLTNVWNWITSNDTIYDFANTADQFLAGVSDTTTFGITTRLREQMYGESATRNHTGGWFIAGQLTGMGLSLALGYGAEAQAANLSTQFVRGARAYDALGTAVGLYDSSQRLARGEADWTDALNFAPLLGFVGGRVAQGLVPHNGTVGAAHKSFFSNEHPHVIYSDDGLVERARELHQTFGYDSRRTLAVGRARHHETGEYVTLYSSSAGKIKDDFVDEHLNLAAGEIAVNVNRKEFAADGFGIINGVHQSHAELNMIQWAQRRGYIIEGIGVSHADGICPHCYAQMVVRGINTTNELFSDFNYIKNVKNKQTGLTQRVLKLPSRPSTIPAWWQAPKISYSSGNGVVTIDPIAQTMTVKTVNGNHSIPI